jgi:flavodoxin I
MNLLIATLLSATSVWAFVPRFGGIRRAGVQLDMSKVGIFFGTSTGSTETVADLLTEAFGDDAEGPFDVDTLEGSLKDIFGKYDTLVVGTPTWNTGADTERSGTGWDELYYGPMQDFKLDGKKVAVFGLGDQISYAENYADATGELHDVFEGLGCQMMGYTSIEGYEHEASKAIRGDKFCGLLCDMVNQEELSEERVQKWVAHLRAEGFLEGDSAASVASTPVAVEPVVVDTFSELEQHSEVIEQAIETHVNGFKSHFNPETKSTMWVSADGRSCYYTVDTIKTSGSP